MVSYIETNGKSLPVKFGMTALSEFCDKTNTTLSGLSNKLSDISLSDAMLLVWVGLKNGHRVLGAKFTITIEQVGDLMDDDPGMLQKMMNVFQVQQPQKEEAQEDKDPNELEV